MDQLITDAKIEIKPTAKTWEPQRAYEKKLVAVMHKGNECSTLVCLS
jgi:cohesin complex subunit SA-1/2